MLKSNLPVSVKRLALETNLIITIISNTKLQSCKKKLETLIAQINIGDSLEIIDSEINSLAIDELGKLLCMIAKSEFDLEFWSKDGTYFISRGVKKELDFGDFYMKYLFLSLINVRIIVTLKDGYFMVRILRSHTLQNLLKPRYLASLYISMKKNV